MNAIEQIADFFYEHGEGLFKEENRLDLKDEIARHIAYGTIKVLRSKKDPNQITAVARWGWVTDDTVEIFDMCVHKKLRHVGITRYMARLCLLQNPSCKFMKYENKDKTKSFTRKRESFFKKGTIKNDKALVKN